MKPQSTHRKYTPRKQLLHIDTHQIKSAPKICSMCNIDTHQCGNIFLSCSKCHIKLYCSQRCCMNDVQHKLTCVSSADLSLYPLTETIILATPLSGKSMLLFK
jgi:hypothetical protein